MPIFVTYKKISESADTTEFVRKWLAEKPPVAKEDLNVDEEILLDSISIPQAVAESIVIQKNTRNNDTVSVIATSAKELSLFILDNGIADNDTISVFYNNKLLVSREEVTVKGINLTITLSDSETEHKIILVAHNLGSIPPNTALVIIDTGSEKYRLNASSDLTKNAVIIVRHQR